MKIFLKSKLILVLVILTMLSGAAITLVRPFSSTNTTAQAAANTKINQQQTVQITAPQDQSIVDRGQTLQVTVNFATVKNSTDKKKGDSDDPIVAVGLLLNGKSVSVHQLKPSQKNGNSTFTVSFASLPQQATQAQLQAQIYHIYDADKRTNKPSATSKIITVNFQANGLSNPIVFTPGQDIQSNTALIDQTGGSITLATGPDSVKGIKVDFPAGALSQATTVSVGYNTGTMTPNEGTYAGVAFTLDTGNVKHFDQPVSITVPYTDTASVPAPFYIDPANHLQPMQLIDVDTTAKTFTFQTFHASWYTWILSLIVGTAYAPGPGDLINSGFVPGDDGFQIVNYGSDYNREGECFGMTSFASWYFQNAKANEGKFYPKYMSQFGTDSFSRAITGQNIIATRAFTSITQQWTTYYSNIVASQRAMSQEMRYALMRTDLKNSGPVLIYLAHSNGTSGAHSVLAYKLFNLDGSISIYDPNYPGQVNTITYNANTKTFNPYAGYDVITEDAQGSLSLTEPYQNILEDADANFHGSKTAQISITSPTNGATVTDRTVQLQGTINSGQVLVNKLTVLVGSTQYMVNIGTDGSFTIPINLERGANHLTFKTEGNDANGQPISAPNNMSATDFVINLNASQSEMLVTLTWDTNDTDLDTYVTDPTGDTSWFQHKVTADGGTLDYDVTTGYGPEHWTLLTTNTIRYNSPYIVRVHYYSDHGHGPTNYTVTIKLYEGTSREQDYSYRGNLSANNPSNAAPGSTGPDWVDVSNVVLQPAS